MLRTHAINSGDYCSNLQINKLDYINGLTPDELRSLRDGIAEAIQAQARRERELERLGSAISEDTYISLLEDRAETSIDPVELVSMIEAWSPNQLRAAHVEILDRLLNEGISAILNSPKTASYIMNNLACDPFIKSILIPACKLSIETEVHLNDLSNFIDSISSFGLLSEQSTTFSMQLYIIRILLSILYRSRSEMEDEELVKILQRIDPVEYSIISQFYVDAFFRAKLYFIHTSSSLEIFLDDNASKYFAKYPNHPLTQLKRALVNPIEIFEQYDIETVRNDLSKLAIMCQNVIESRWVVTALLRLLPLYKTADLDLDYDKHIEHVTSNFSEAILSKFNFLAYTNLRSMLYIFNMTGDVSYLKKYEKLFVVKNGILNWYQQIALQIEYASAIYMYLLNNSTEVLIETKFGVLVEKGGDAPIQSILFSNIIIADDVELYAISSGCSKGLLLKWLYHYVEKIYSLHTEKQLEGNPFALFNYRATAKVPLLRGRIVSLVTEFVKEEDSSGRIAASPSYSSKVLSLVEFSRASKALECGRIEILIDSAMQSSKYNILLNAKAIAYAMYKLRYYCESASISTSKRLLRKFKKATDYFKNTTRLFLATAECVSLASEKKELDFVVSLYETLQKANKKLFQLALRREEIFNLAIPDETIGAINYYEKQGSVLAHIGRDYLLVPEYWNLLATTIFNLKYPDEMKSCDISSYFYSVAKCFAREQKSIDQKYSYNHIRTRSLYYIHAHIKPPDGFIRDCSYYINRLNNQYFSYKNECCKPFFYLIKKYYDSLPGDIKELYQKQILPNHHWVKKVFFDLKIGVFSDNIQIK